MDIRRTAAPERMHNREYNNGLEQLLNSGMDCKGRSRVFIEDLQWAIAVQIRVKLRIFKIRLPYNTDIITNVFNFIGPRTVN